MTRAASAGPILLLALAAALPARLPAQGLPPYLAVNPALTSRGGLYFQPYVDPAPGWQVRLLLDYASAIEYSETPDARFILDAELLRLDATVTRDLGSAFVGASVGINGAYGGFLDGFLDWYHEVTGLRVAAREVRPRNEFEYELILPDRAPIRREASSAFLGDARLLAGHRHTRHWQTTVAVTLPTATGPRGYGRGTVSASAITTVRVPLDPRLSFEGSAGLGVTPRHGDLEAVQRTVFGSASGGVRWRFWGRQAAFINLFYQSAGYRDTGVRALDQRELTLDYGFLLRARKGPEIFLGMTEDLEPRGPAIDLSFRIGARW
jgi:catechol 2,3-dioxygenase-like lactoylglutathione lyase family enzyme